MGIWFSRNGVQGTTEQAPAGHPVYVVTAANGATMRTDVSVLAQSVAIEWSVCPPTAPASRKCSCQPHPIFGHEDRCRYAGMGPASRQIESPLPTVERCASGLATGANLTMPTKMQSYAMACAVKWSSAQLNRPAVIYRTSRTNIRTLLAMSRRGWLDLDHPIRPTCGTLTDAGRRALARYESKHGAPVSAR